MLHATTTYQACGVFFVWCSLRIVGQAVRKSFCESVKNGSWTAKAVQELTHKWSLITPTLKYAALECKYKETIRTPCWKTFWNFWWSLIIFIYTQSGAKIDLSLLDKWILAPDWVELKIIKNHQKFQNFFSIGCSDFLFFYLHSKVAYLSVGVIKDHLWVNSWTTLWTALMLSLSNTLFTSSTGHWD